MQLQPRALSTCLNTCILSCRGSLPCFSVLLQMRGEDGIPKILKKTQKTPKGTQRNARHKQNVAEAPGGDGRPNKHGRPSRRRKHKSSKTTAK